MQEANYKVYRSYDYDQFHTLEENRRLSPTNVALIEKSIEEVGPMRVPILCTEKDGKLYIADGQHRFAALKNQGKPIDYIIDDVDIKAIQALNRGQKNWSKGDYIRSYVREGNEDYKRFTEVVKQSGLGVDVTYALIYNHRDNGQIIDGSLELSEAQAEAAGQKIDYVCQFKEVAKKIGGRSTSFYMAIGWIFEYYRERLDREGLRIRLEERYFDVPPVANIQSLLVCISRIYNKGLRLESRLYMEGDYSRYCIEYNSKMNRERREKGREI